MTSNERKQRGPSGTPYPEEYVSQAEIDALNAERRAFGTGHSQQAEHLLREAAPEAALTIIRLSQASPKDNIRLAAARFILDKVLPKEGLHQPEDSLEKFLSGLQKED